jgi:hypothetical protein
MKMPLVISTAVALSIGQIASADVCDYRPSSLLGGSTATATGVATGATAATGVGMKVAGVYTITHATTGAAMLGSTAAGASAAGTAGIIAGTAGFLGTVGAVLMSPFVIVPTAVAAVGIGAYEGACYLAGADEANEQQSVNE